MSNRCLLKDKLSKLIVDHVSGISFKHLQKKGEICLQAAAFSSVAPVLLPDNWNSTKTKEKHSVREVNERWRPFSTLPGMTASCSLIIQGNPTWWRKCNPAPGLGEVWGCGTGSGVFRCVNRAEDERRGDTAGYLCSCLLCLAPITTDTTLHFLFHPGNNYPPWEVSLPLSNAWLSHVEVGTEPTQSFPVVTAQQNDSLRTEADVFKNQTWILYVRRSGEAASVIWPFSHKNTKYLVVLAL